MYFRYRSLPELEGLNKREKDALWKQAQRDPFRFSDIGVLLVILVVMAFMVLSLQYLPKDPAWQYFPFAFVCWFGGYFLIDAIMILRYRPNLRRILGESKTA